MTEQASRLVIVSPPELVPGFRLAGAGTRAAHTPEDAEEVVKDLIAGGEAGVIGVYEPFFSGFERAVRVRLSGSVAPVVVPLPSGLEVEADAARRARLASLLRRAVGYHITFGEEEEE